MQRIYNILESFLGESKQGYFDKGTAQYQFNCPWCREENGGMPDGKYNLEINFSLGKYHCWKDGYAGNLSRLIKIWAGNESVNEYYSIIKELKESKFYDLDLFKDDGTLDEFGNVLSLPKSFRKIDLNYCRNRNLVDYLNSRKITQDIIDFYNIGYTPWEEEDTAWRNRIIIPSYNSIGDLNYYVGRVFNKNDKRIKYRNCDADKKKIVLHEDKIQWNADIVLVEGTFDCIYYPNTISLLGKVLTKDSEIYDKLVDRANGNIIIAIDGDTDINETKRIYNLLNNGRLRGKIKYIRLGEGNLPWKDFGEAYEDKGKEGIIECLRSAKQFSEMELNCFIK